jgi:rRNA-processing protein FCF1
MAFLTLSLMPSASGMVVVDTLDRLLSRLHAVPSGDKFELLTGYLQWASGAAGDLAPLVSAEDVARLILTPRHWVLCGIDPAANQALPSIVHVEMEDRRRELTAAKEALQLEVRRWDAHLGHLVVPDTNVYLHHELPFTQVDWMTLVEARTYDPLQLIVPLVVVDELDKGKRGKPEIRTRARQTLKTFDEMFPDPRLAVPLEGAGFASPIRVHLFLDPPRHVRLPMPDDEIVDRASALSQLAHRSVTIITFDTGMALRARTAGLEVLKLQDV